ncbi:MAG TPA: hypothetical protein VJ885_04085 [Thermoanaerobaculia bacterium]|jgi:hypothetical protein|nr:hypothetical protein [Thermoanaerobaculia bacterium]
MLEVERDNPPRSHLSNVTPFALTVLLLVLAYHGAQSFSDMVGSAPPIPTFETPPPALQPPLSSWPNTPYLEVRAYYSDFPALSDLTYRGIPGVVKDKDGVLLTREQERRLISAVTTSGKPSEPFGCWYPRHAFLYYDPFGKPVAEVNVCFDCRGVMGGPTDHPDIDALARLVTDLGLPLGPDKPLEWLKMGSVSE